MIEQPIPYVVGMFVTFSDTLSQDDPTETLTVTRPDGTIQETVDYADLTKTSVNGQFVFTAQVQITQAGRTVGTFQSTGAAANRTYPIWAYAV